MSDTSSRLRTTSGDECFGNKLLLRRRVIRRLRGGLGRHRGAQQVAPRAAAVNNLLGAVWLTEQKPAAPKMKRTAEALEARRRPLIPPQKQWSETRVDSYNHGKPVAI